MANETREVGKQRGSAGQTGSFDPNMPGRAGPALQGPRLDQAAPPFTARTTHGMCSLDDYRGQWLVLFAHPADFTPVCTSEFVALARAVDRFHERDCALLGLSVDSIFAHLAWVRSIRESFGVQVTFPIIEDVSMEIAAAYGMIHATSTSTGTVRAVFFIDPEGILRALQYYPMSVGRSVKEILRILTALQATRGGDLATPEGWADGDKLLAAPPLTTAEVQVRNDDPHTLAWYYTEQTP